jgi:site-specific DNA recombinase
MKTAIGYIRVSTEAQATNGISLAQQESAIRSWAERNGYEVEMHIDAGLSGKNTKRPALAKALSRACKAKAPLVVYSLSRFSRSVTDCLEMAGKLEKAGADLVSLSESIDTLSPTGRFTFTILSAVNQLQREIIAEDTREKMGYLRTQNRVISPRIPYGYDSDGRNLIRNELEWSVLERMAAMRAEGQTLSGIAATLNSEGIPAKLGGTWLHATVKQCLSRREKVAV